MLLIVLVRNYLLCRMVGLFFAIEIWYLIVEVLRTCPLLHFILDALAMGPSNE